MMLLTQEYHTLPFRAYSQNPLHWDEELPIREKLQEIWKAKREKKLCSVLAAAAGLMREGEVHSSSLGYSWGPPCGCCTLRL